MYFHGMAIQWGFGTRRWAILSWHSKLLQRLLLMPVAQLAARRPRVHPCAQHLLAQTPTLAITVVPELELHRAYGSDADLCAGRETHVGSRRAYEEGF